MILNTEKITLNIIKRSHFVGYADFETYLQNTETKLKFARTCSSVSKLNIDQTLQIKRDIAQRVHNGIGHITCTRIDNDWVEITYTHKTWVKGL